MYEKTVRLKISTPELNRLQQMFLRDKKLGLYRLLPYGVNLTIRHINPKEGIREAKFSCDPRSLNPRERITPDQLDRIIMKGFGKYIIYEDKMKMDKDRSGTFTFSSYPFLKQGREKLDAAHSGSQLMTKQQILNATQAVRYESILSKNPIGKDFRFTNLQEKQNHYSVDMVKTEG